MVVRKMKEKCKDAARMRRDKERAEFVELSKLLPLPSSTTSQLDKASIIRLTSSYLRMRSAFPEGLGVNWGINRHHLSKTNSSAPKLGHQQHFNHKSHVGTELQHQTSAQFHQQQQHQQQHQQQKQQQQIKELGSLILQTLDGFVFALHKDGKIMYISETASVHLGLPQIDLTGSSIFEYIHPADHNDICEVLNLNDDDKSQLRANSSDCTNFELGRSFCMRMKCILPKRNAGLINDGYKAIHCNGYLKARCIMSKPETKVVTNSSQSIDWDSYALVAVGHSLLPTASTKVKLTGNSFMFKANLDFKLFSIEALVTKLLDFELAELIGQSLYQFVHANDVCALEYSHKTLLEKGQVVTKYYRLMKKGGGFVWVQSYASLINNPRNMPKQQQIVGICFVLGENLTDKSVILYSQPGERQQMQADNSLSEKLTFGGASTSNTNFSFESKSNTHQSITLAAELSDNNIQAKKRQAKVLATIKKSRRVTIRSGSSDNMIDKTNSEMLQSSNSSVALVVGQLPNSRDLCNLHYQKSPRVRSDPAVSSSAPIISTIGSLRRPSDDSSSVISSIASSTSACSCYQSASNSHQIQQLPHSSSNHLTNNDLFSSYAPSSVIELEHNHLPSTVDHLSSNCSINCSSCSSTSIAESYTITGIPLYDECLHHHHQQPNPIQQTSSQIWISSNNSFDELPANQHEKMVNHFNQPTTSCNLTSSSSDSSYFQQNNQTLHYHQIPVNNSYTMSI